MAEYYEREKVIEFIRSYRSSTDVAFHMEEHLNEIPAADVRPVVLCKDCVYSDNWYADRLICYLWNELDGNSVFEDGFCNYGKKRVES